MAQFDTSLFIKAGPAEVFDVFADLRNAADRISAIKKIELLTEGPVRAGTRFAETRIMFKRECTEQMEITEFKPPAGYTVRCVSCGVDVSTRFDFQPAPGGTNVIVTIQSRPLTLFAKLMSPLSALMFKPMMKKCMEQDFAELKAAIEGGPAPACAAG